MARDVTDARARRGDVTPDSQRARYEARGGEVTSIGDELDASYESGFGAGARAQRGAGDRRALTLQRPGGFSSIAAPFAVELVLISVDEIANYHRPPLPSRLLAAFAVFGILGLAQGDAAPAANVFAWGLVLATLYAGTGPKGSGTPAAIRSLQTVGDFIGGKYGQPTKRKAK
jgi:hypothetical protein